MDDEELVHTISQLVDEEHRLERHSSGGNPLSADDEARLGGPRGGGTPLGAAGGAGLEMRELAPARAGDRLRHRRPRPRAGLDPDEAPSRDPAVVERYLQ